MTIHEDRSRLLPQLVRIPHRPNCPKPGNCAEAETLCHLRRFLAEMGTVEGLVALTVTMSLRDGSSSKNCERCEHLLRILRKEHKGLQTLDLIPTKSSE